MARTTVLIVKDGSATELKGVPLEPAGLTKADGCYDEAWLQGLIQAYPNILPVSEIEPGFGRLIPVCREPSCRHGSIDHLFVTADGGVAIVETKLWRNGEARRKVVSQALDYVSALSKMSYAEFEAMALGGLLAVGVSKPGSLHELVARSPDALAESEFADAVSLNLKRGRLLVLVVGDGIRAEAEALFELLQSHAGSRFTFALVALELFVGPEGAIIVVPRPIAKTALIERGVVKLMDDRVVVEPEPKLAGETTRKTMTEELFMELMAARAPELPGAIRDFIDRAQSIGVHPEWRQTLMFKWYGWPDSAVNLGYIDRGGALWTDATNWKVGGDRARAYIEELAQVAGGHVRQSTNGPYVVGSDGKTAVRVEALLPARADAWLGAMASFIERLKTEIPEQA
jgi:hypothetical protein